MAEIDFKVNEYAILFSHLDEKITREVVMRKYPETVKYYEKLGQKNTPWDKRLTSFIKDNPNFFGNEKIIKGKIFRDFASHSPLSGNENFHKTLENLMVYGCDVSEEELNNMRDIFPKFKSLMETEEFGHVVSMAKNYRNVMENRWKESADTINKCFTDIIGYDMSNKDKRVIAFIMPPISENERNYQLTSNKVYFFWSQPESVKKELKDYGITSIAHEKLHQLLPYKSTMTSNKKKEFHAFIKFVAIKEIYSRITGKSYLENDSKNEDGKIMGLIYPYWLGYLHRKDENPEVEIEKDIQRDKEVFDRLKPNSRKRKLYEDYNFEKLSPEKIARFFRYKKGILPYEFIELDFNSVNVYQDEFLQDNNSR